MSDVVVVDTSLVVKWLIDEEDSDRARVLASGWMSNGVRVAAPHLMLAELANALHRQVVDGHLTPAEASTLIDQVLTDRLELHHIPQLYGRALELASLLGQGASYDSLYLALAESLNCEFWTADSRSYRAAQSRFDLIRVLDDSVPLA